MTMHMIQGVNSLNTRKRKPKMTKANLERWTLEMHVYNKHAKRRGDQRLTLDQYIDYAHGKGLPKKERKFETYVPPTVYRRADTSHIPSNQSTTGSCARIEPMKYTGTLVKGISTMHKSNAVPIIDEREAKEHANMRR